MTKELEMQDGRESGVGSKQRFGKNKLHTWARLTVWSGDKSRNRERQLLPLSIKVAGHVDIKQWNAESIYFTLV